MYKIYFVSGSFVKAQCSLERVVAFVSAIARTACNCFHQKPNNKKMRAKLLDLST